MVVIPVQTEQKALTGSAKSQSVTVITSATKIPTTNLKGRKTIAIINTGSTTVEIGGSDVTIGSGFPLAQNDTISLDATEDVDIYGIVASSTSDVRALEVI